MKDAINITILVCIAMIHIVLILQYTLQRHVISTSNKLLTLEPTTRYMPCPFIMFKDKRHALIIADSTHIILYKFGTKVNKARVLSKKQTKRLMTAFNRRCNDKTI